MAYAACFVLAAALAACSMGGGSGGGSAKEITSFSILGTSGTIDQAAHTIRVVVMSNSLSGLVATFTTSGQKVMVSGTTQTSGVTANNYVATVTYVVTAADGSTVSYVVTVLKAAGSQCTANSECASTSCVATACQ